MPDVRSLVLVRHGKAQAHAPGGAAGGTDHARGLTARGVAQAAATARWLTDAGLGRPDLVLVSSAARAAQTWEAMAPGLHPGTVREEPALYETSPQALVALLAELPDEVASLLLVGHEPVLSGAATALAGGGSELSEVSGLSLAARVAAGVATGSAVVLEADGPWTSLRWGSARLVGYHVP